MEIVRWDIHDAVRVLLPGEDWGAEEEELWRIIEAEASSPGMQRSA